MRFRLLVSVGAITTLFVSSKIVDNDPPVPQSWYELMAPGSKYLREKSPKNLPSVRISEEEDKKIKRSIYGGKGDKPHLGGFTDFDPQGYSSNAFNYMIGHLNIRSMIDLGCGKGFSTKYFLDAGADVLCAEGSHDAVLQSILPANKVVEHDFSRGPWWPDRTFDALWSVEFLEHVGRQHMQNYMPVLHKAALIFVTSSGWGGWHHVEVHGQTWWMARMAKHGFIFNRGLTQDIRRFAKREIGRNETHKSMGQHITHSMMVFVNPKVASLPQHEHVIGGNGCYGGKIENKDNGAPCTGVDALPPSFEALLDCKLDQSDWWDCKKNSRTGLRV